MSITTTTEMNAKGVVLERLPGLFGEAQPLRKSQTIRSKATITA